MKRARFTVCCVAVLALFAAGCSTQGASQEPSGSSVSFDKNDPGYKQFAQTCAGCHGVDLQGVAGPNLQHVGARMTKQQIETQILNGKGGMPGFQGRLSAQKVNDLAEFLSKLK